MQAIRKRSNDSSIEIIRSLVEAKVSVNYQDAENSNPLLCAVEHDQVDVVRYLIEKGASVNSSDGRFTPLMLAVCRRREILDELLRHKADPNIVNDCGESALGWAVTTPMPQIVARLLESKATLWPSCLHVLLDNSYFNSAKDMAEVFEILLDAKADVFYKGEEEEENDQPPLLNMILSKKNINPVGD